MTQVNLLPWREQARQVQKIRFFALFGLTLVLAIILIIILYVIIDKMIAGQQSINAFLEDQLGQEKASVTHLKKQETEKENQVGQLQFDYSLQKDTFNTVRLLNILAQSTPDGIMLTKITRISNKITLIGKTQSTTEVTAFMNNIEKTNEFNQPVLTKITGSQNKDPKNQDQDFFQIELTRKE